MSSNPRRFALGVFLSSSLAWLPAREAAACAACGCGDPTLTAAGTEQPFAGRLRSSVELRHRTDSIGEPGVDETEIREFRSDLAVAWAPIETLFAVVTVPFLYREVTDPSLATDKAWGLGDVEARVKFFAFRDRPLAPRHLLAGVVGIKAPTAGQREDSSGEPLPLEAQPGTGSWDLLVGPSYALFSGKLSSYLSAQLAVPLASQDDVEPGVSVRTTLAGQYQALTWLALRAAVDTRWDAESREQGAVNPNSGGFVAFAGGDVLTSPMQDTTVLVGARAPVIEELNGFHDEGWTFAVAMSQDW